MVLHMSVFRDIFCQCMKSRFFAAAETQTRESKIMSHCTRRMNWMDGRDKYVIHRCTEVGWSLSSGLVGGGGVALVDGWLHRLRADCG